MRPYEYPEVKQALNWLSAQLRVPVSWIIELIQKESNWEPLKKNPLSDAVGLIQFTKPAAIDLGFKTSAEVVAKYPDIVSQLYNPVYQYLKRYLPFTTNAEFYLSVFYPKYRKYNYSQLLPQNVRDDNPGIETPAHYVAYVKGVLTRYDRGEIPVLSLIESNPVISIPAVSDKTAVVITPEEEIVVPSPKINKTVIGAVLITGVGIYYLLNTKR